MMKLLVMDVETTGFDPDKDAVCEVAGAVVDCGKVTETFDHLVNPGMLIPPEAMGVHHILDRHVVDKPDLGLVLRDKVLCYTPFIPVCHNLEFDSKFLMLAQPGICTYRCAKHLYPECPSFSNQTLRYYLKLFKEPEPKAMPPHRAKADVWVTAHVLIRMMLQHSAEELVALTKRPILLKTVHFGKHRGEEWSQVPKGYLQWIMKQDFDRDVMHTARHYV